MATILRIRRRWTGSYDLTATAYDADGLEADATAGTVSIFDSAGVEIVTDGTCGIDDGVLTYDLDVADVPALDVYECRWTATVAGDSIEWRTRFELVGDYLFEISDLRAHDGGTFASTTDYPTATLAAARTWVEQRMEGGGGAGVAFVPRGSRETHYGGGTHYLQLNHPKVSEVYSIVENGTAWADTDVAEVEIRHGWLYLQGTWDADSEYVVHYEHGYTDTPAPISEAGLILAAEYLVTNNLRSRATSESTDVGFLRLSVAGPGGRTGIPEVDAVIADYREKAVRIG